MIDPKKHVITKEQNITKEKIKRFLPKKSAHQVTDEVIEIISRMGQDTGLMQDYLEEQMLMYMPRVMSEMKISIKNYLEALKYVAVKKFTDTNKQAYEIVFPERLKRLEEKARDEGRKINVDAYVTEFNKNPIVVKLETFSVVHSSIIHAAKNNMSIEKMAQLAQGFAAPTPDGEPQKVTPLVQMQSLRNLWEMTKAPDESHMTLTIEKGDKELEQQKKMHDTVAEMVALQKKAFAEGKSLQEVQKVWNENRHADIIDIVED